MSKKSKKELEYTIEALEDEIEDLTESLREEHEKLWKVIKENDRLTLTYEPYRPPGDENEGKDFYGLVEENKNLHKTIELLRNQNVNLAEELRDVRKRIVEIQISSKEKKRIKKYGGISFDFWPPKDWFRFSYKKWHPGMSAQLCIGPIRIDWQAE